MNLCGLLQLASKTDRELVADPVHGAVHVPPRTGLSWKNPRAENQNLKPSCDFGGYGASFGKRQFRSKTEIRIFSLRNMLVLVVNVMHLREQANSFGERFRYDQIQHCFP
jgi:hypothetical protein